MADYDVLLDAEVRAFLARTEADYPPDAVSLSIAEQRALYDRMCIQFHQSHPPGITVTDVDADGVPCRIYEMGDPTVTVLYCHGGGFVVGGLDSHDDICAEICAGTGFRVVSVDYRLCPEHIHPAAFEDARCAYDWVAARFEGPIVLAGDSAGGNLCAALAHALRGAKTRVIGQVLIYPGLGGDMTRGSYVEHANAPGLSTDDIRFYADLRTGGQEVQNDPTLAPLQDHSFAELPPTVIFTADCDPLRDDGPDYVARLNAAGGKAISINEPGLVHGYLRARSMSSRARESFEAIVLAVEALGQKLWSWD